MPDPFHTLRTARTQPTTAGVSSSVRRAIGAAEVRSDRAGWGIAELGNMLASGLVGGVAGNMLVLLAGVGKGPVAGIVAGGVAALAVEFTRNLVRTARSSVFDSPEYQDLLRGLRERLDVGPVAARRASAWVVHEGRGAEPKILSDKEYAAYRETTPRIDEIRISGDTLVLRRLRDGVLDSSHTASPAIERFDIGSRRALKSEWFVAGVPANEAESLAAYEAYRIETPAAPGQREIYGSSRINQADERRRAEAGDIEDDAGLACPGMR